MFKSVEQKIDFPKMERELLDWWSKNGIVHKYLHKNDSVKQNFSFLDGPITANNPMGVHHGWSRTYKDLWQRYHNMKGEKQRFQNGFDCQGLWVEVEVEKSLALGNKRDIENLVPGDKFASVEKFIQLCKERVKKYAAIQTEQSKRLAYFMDWDHSYFTMSDENNYTIWHFLKVCFERGWIYKGHDSVPWCPRCETAISQHEMLTEDYKEIMHKAVYMRFPLVGAEKEFLLVWTTTPWTIPANICVAVDREIDYSLVEFEEKRYWVAQKLVDKVFLDDFGQARTTKRILKQVQDDGKSTYKIIKTVKGQELVGLKYLGAFDDLEEVKKAAKNEKFHTVVITDPLLLPITTDEGTGMVHTAVSAGEEDFKLGKKLGLPLIPVIADNADYLPGLGFLSGQNAKKHPEIILDYLENEGFVFKIENYLHRYPACWRCKTELVWKVADEWYISMDSRPLQIRNSKFEIRNKTLREQLVETAKKINWLPEFGLERELDWLKNMHDWLISKKNRYWGLALPIYECQKCGGFEVIGGKEELKKRAVEGYGGTGGFEGHSPHKPWIDKVKIKCLKCQSLTERIPDVGNPWLDAGIVPFATMTKEWFPADFITESFPGQFKNWFYSLLVMSTVLEGQEPAKTILGFATLMGEDGRPMHKSWGNAIEFNEGADKIGVDVMRWMFIIQNPAENLLFGYHRADEVRRQFHLMLWNVYNFFITYANVDKWTGSKRILKQVQDDNGKENILDRWIKARLNELIKIVTDSLDKYDVQTSGLEIEKFVSDLSLWYVRRSRDRIGPTVENNEDKKNCYRTLHEVLVTLSKLLAPLTPFMAEEMFKNLTGEESVHLTEWPEVCHPERSEGSQDSSATPQNDTIFEEMEMTRKICELGHAQRKLAGIKVRQPLRKLIVTCHPERSEGSRDSSATPQNDTKNYEQLLKDELNVKEIKWVDGKGELAVELDIQITPELKAEGEARGFVREVQQLRKEKGYRMDEKITVKGPYPKEFADYIKKETLAEELVWQNSLEILTG